MGCSVHHIKITENDSNNSSISQDLQEIEISILSINEGIQCIKNNIEQEKQNYPDDIIINQIEEQLQSNFTSQESSVQSDCPSKKSCLKQLSGSSLTLSKYASASKKVQFNFSQSQFSKKKKQKKRKRKTQLKPIDLDQIF